MSLLFNMLSRLVIVFLPRSKHLLISWLQSPSAMILEPKKIKSVTVSIFFPSICHKVMGPDAMIFVFWVLASFFHSPLSLSIKGSLVPLFSYIYVIYMYTCIFFFRLFSIIIYYKILSIVTRYTVGHCCLSILFCFNIFLFVSSESSLQHVGSSIFVA